MFKNISNFNNTSDYIAILNGAIFAELVVLFIVYYTPYFNSQKLMDWYETYQLSAVIADVLILVIGLILTRFVFKIYNIQWNILTFIVIMLTIQIIHDILFYGVFMIVPRGTNKMLDLFKDYANEVGSKAILGDSFMIVISALSAMLFANLSVNHNIILNIFLVYLIPYILHTN
jgi:hypothetical protein